MRIPEKPCPICRRMRCQDPTHKRPARKPFAGAVRQVARPAYGTAEQIARRKAAVDAFLSAHGFPLADGTTAARCPECGQVRTRWVADHVVPIAMGGSEDGPLAVHCKQCSSRQGARLVNERRRHGRRHD